MSYQPVPITNVKFPPYGMEVEHGVIQFGQYQTGDVAIQIMDYEEGLYSIPTVNLEAYDLKPSEGHVFIKDYSESEGVWEKLHELGVISEPVRSVPFGPYDAKVQECKITAPPII